MADTQQQSQQQSSTMAIVFGYLGADQPDYKQAKALQQSLGSDRVKIIGDGMTGVTPDDIHRELSKIKGPVDVIVDSHGGQVDKNYYSSTDPRDKPYTHLNGQYTVTFDSGRPDTDGMPVDKVNVPVDGKMVSYDLTANQNVPVQDVLKAMPSNVKNVYLGSCGSEAALQHADLLPKGTALYASSAKDSTTTGIGVASMIDNTGRNMAAHDPHPMRTAFGQYLATGLSPSNDTSIAKGGLNNKSPSQFAVSGQGIQNIDGAEKGMKGHTFSDRAVTATTDMLQNSTYATTDYQRDIKGDVTPTTSQLKSYVQGIGGQITNGAPPLSADAVSHIEGHNVLEPTQKTVSNEVPETGVARALTFNEVNAQADKQHVSFNDAAKEISGKAPDAHTTPAKQPAAQPAQQVTKAQHADVSASQKPTASQSPPAEHSKFAGLLQAHGLHKDSCVQSASQKVSGTKDTHLQEQQASGAQLTAKTQQKSQDAAQQSH